MSTRPPSAADPFASAAADAAKDQATAAQIITACNAALRVFKIHSTDNQAVTQPMRSIAQALEQLQERHPKVVLAHVEGVYYLGDHRVRMSGAQQQIADQFTVELGQRALGGITFEGVPPEHELVSFFEILSAHAATAGGGAETIRRALRDAAVSQISVSRVLRAITEAEQSRGTPNRAADVYSAAIRHAIACAQAGTMLVSTARSKRVVHELVDIAEQDPTVLVALAGLRGTGSDAAEHSISTAVLSVAFGRRLGLPRALLADLGVAALHHDQGLDLLGPGFEDDVARHPLLALGALAQAGSIDAPVLRQVVCSFEHHRDHVGSGHPAIPASLVPHPLSQIVRVASDFDGLTRGRHRPAALDVQEALLALQAGAGRAYHPGLVALFVDLVGGIDAEPASSRQGAMLDDRAGQAEKADAGPAYGEIDAMLAEFLGKQDVVKQQRARRERAAAKAATATPAPVQAKLGAMKLKKIRKRRPEA